MNLNQIEIKNFILALFKRDDGERFLLGAGAYEFNEQLQHFQPNIIANDIVEKQGTDGQLLAGQVLRSATQNFDGYIGDATMTRIDTETARRNFMRFFQTNHHYTVIYILPDGSAIQRQGGYLVDAPSVPENDQRFPEYHVALAFENVHYYSYAENPDGSETYASIWSIEPTGILTGGLVWDNTGVEWEGSHRTLNAIKGNTSQSGTPTPSVPKPINCATGAQTVTINGTAYPLNLGKNLFDKNNAQIISAYVNSSGVITSGSGTRILYIPCKPGTTYTVSKTNSGTNQRFCIFDAATTPSIGNSIINSVGTRSGLDTASTYTITTGASARFLGVFFRVAATTPSEDDILATIQIEKGNSATAYANYITPIELHEIGDGIDSIYPSGEDWILKKETASYTFDTATGTGITWDGTRKRLYFSNTWQSANGVNFDPHTDTTTPAAILSDKFESISFNSLYNDGNNGVALSSSTTLSFRDNSWANDTAARNAIIGNTMVYKMSTATTTTITDPGLIAQLDAIKAALENGGAISITPSGSNLAVVMDAPENGTGGAIWEDQGGTSYTEVVNAGLATASPIWTVEGYADAPSITNETTGQTLSFSGTVPAGQTLIVDCGAQTAYIEGVDVKNQISGQWPEIRPGANLISYTGADVSTNCELKWNEVIE